MNQKEIDKKNSIYWDELCGSNAANQINIINDSDQELLKFDNWYFKYYPWLTKYIPFNRMKGKNVLEIGLGYGFVSQRIMESGAYYYGIDIARGPVEMVKKRLLSLNLDGKVVVESILEEKSIFENEKFDFIVAIGSLHHTGNLKTSIDKVYGLLKHDGEAIIMVYNALSYRQWIYMPFTAIKFWFNFSFNKVSSFLANERLRFYYDFSLEGDAAPQTEFVTKNQLKLMCKKFKHFSVDSENIGEESFLRFLNRKFICILFGKILGLDLYCNIKK